MDKKADSCQNVGERSSQLEKKRHDYVEEAVSNPGPGLDLL
jgi:hypothetical protein